MAEITLPADRVRVEQLDVTLEQVCFEYAWTITGDRRRAGRLRGYVEATLVANPGLAELGMTLPLDTIVILPRFVVSDPDTTPKRLWG